MYATRDHEARQIVVTEAAELYVKLPAFAGTLHEAAREVGDFAVDLMKVLQKETVARNIENVKAMRIAIGRLSTTRMNRSGSRQSSGKHVATTKTVGPQSVRRMESGHLRSV